MEMTQRTFFCGDLFTHGGKAESAITPNDILEPSEAFRRPMDYFAHAPQTKRTLARLAAAKPSRLLSCTAAPGPATEQRCSRRSAKQWIGAELLDHPQGTMY